jgi:hypothetical protein
MLFLTQPQFTRQKAKEQLPTDDWELQKMMEGDDRVRSIAKKM